MHLAKALSFQMRFIKQFSEVQQNYKERHGEEGINFKLLILMPQSQNRYTVIGRTEPVQRVIERGQAMGPELSSHYARTCKILIDGQYHFLSALSAACVCFCWLGSCVKKKK